MSVAMTQFGSAAMSASMMISSINNAINVFKDEGATGFEKFGAAISILTSTMSAFNAVQALSTTLTKSDLVSKIAAAFGYKIVTTSSGALTLAKTTETGAVVANTAAWYANPIMWIALVVMGVVAAIALLTAGIYALATAETEEEKNARKAAETYESLSEAASAATDKVNDLKSAFDGYDDVVDKLNQCVKGTQEWYQALEEVNNYVV
jgi:predicted membrane protein